MPKEGASAEGAAAPVSRATPVKRATSVNAATSRAVAAKTTAAKKSAAKTTAAKAAPAKRSAASRKPVKQSPREARRLQRIELSREQILDTAEELFATHGYYDTGLKDVAAKCEFSVGSIYTFFESKDVLYEQVLMRRSIGVDALQILAPDSMPADERLVRVAEVLINHSVEHPAWGALTAEVTRIARSPGTAIPEVWSHHAQRLQKFLVDVVRQGQEDGTLRPGSPKSLARLYWAVVTSFIVVSAMGTMYGTDQPDDPQEFLTFLHDTFSARTSDDSDGE
ncbi:AcrR family transcriptional regulator [Rhodococcus sp. OAS809]